MRCGWGHHFYPSLPSFSFFLTLNHYPRHFATSSPHFLSTYQNQITKNPYKLEGILKTPKQQAARRSGVRGSHTPPTRGWGGGGGRVGGRMIVGWWGGGGGAPFSGGWGGGVGGGGGGGGGYHPSPQTYVPLPTKFFFGFVARGVLCGNTGNRGSPQDPPVHSDPMSRIVPSTGPERPLPDAQRHARFCQKKCANLVLTRRALRHNVAGGVAVVSRPQPMQGAAATVAARRSSRVRERRSRPPCSPSPIYNRQQPARHPCGQHASTHLNSPPHPR